MLPPFPPPLFILLGIDIFLGGSIVTVMFDEQFPTALPYMLDFGSLVGFVQLVLGPQYLTGYPAEAQFYYCMAFAAVAVLSILGSNLYVVFVRRRIKIAGVLAVVATIPSTLVTVYFVSAYVNDVPVSLPTIPLLPWPIVWFAFFAASAIVGIAIVLVTKSRQSKTEQKREGDSESLASLEPTGPTT